MTKTTNTNSLPAASAEELNDVLGKLTDLLQGGNGKFPNGGGSGPIVLPGPGPDDFGVADRASIRHAKKSARDEVAHQFMLLQMLPPLTQSDAKAMEEDVIESLKELVDLQFLPTRRTEIQEFMVEAIEHALAQLDETDSLEDAVELILSMLDDAGLLDERDERNPFAVALGAMAAPALVGLVIVFIGATSLGYLVEKDKREQQGKGDKNVAAPRGRAPDPSTGERSFLPVPGDDGPGIPLPGGSKRPGSPWPWPGPAGSGGGDIFDILGSVYPRPDVRAALSGSVSAAAAYVAHDEEAAKALDVLIGISEIEDAVSEATGEEREPMTLLTAAIILGGTALVALAGYNFGKYLASDRGTGGGKKPEGESEPQQGGGKEVRPRP